MCRGVVPKHKLTVLKGLDELAKFTVSTKTLRTESSNSSIDTEDPLIKSCLKVKTQTESLQRQVTSSSSEKSVHFSTLEIRSFPRRLGDHPSTSSGPPLTLAWDPETTTSFQVQDYEDERGDRRTQHELIVPNYVRRDWLRDEGYALGELMRAQDSAMRIKRSRMLSAQESIVVMERKEIIKRKFKKWVLQEPSDKELYVKWKQAQENLVTTTTTNQVIDCST